MSLRDDLRTQRIASGITGIIGGGLGLAGVFSGNRGLMAAGAGLSGASMAMSPDIPLWRRPYPYIRRHCCMSWGYDMRLNRFMDRLAYRMAHGMFHPRPHFHHHGPFGPMGPHRGRW